MKYRKNLLLLMIIFVFAFSGWTSAEGVSFSVNTESGIFDQPSFALVKYASLFVEDLGDFSDEPLMTLTVNNDFKKPIVGYFEAALHTSDGTELGYAKIVPFEISPGEATWEIKTGGLTTANLESFIDKANNEEEIDKEYVLDKLDLGDIENWEIDKAHGNESWVKENIYNWDEIEEFSTDDIETFLSLKVPSGKYKIEITFNYTDPEDNKDSETRNIDWEVTNPEPVELVSPEDGIEDIVGEPEFSWQLSDLPAGFETSSKLVITDTVTGKSKSIKYEHSSGYDSEFTATVSKSEYSFLRGRWYEWTVVLTDPRGETVGGEVPEAQGFALSNTLPEITLSGNNLDNLWEGDTASFIADISDEGTPLSDMIINWTLDGEDLDVDGTTYTYYNMTAGTHDIEVEVIDGFEASVSEKLSFTVQQNSLPEVSIDLLDGETEYIVGQVVHLGSIISDEEDEGYSRIDWYVDGSLVSSGETFDLKLGNDGERTITLRVEDVRGGVGEDSVTIYVEENQSPEVTINNPQPGEYLVGETLNLDATASDDLITDPEIFWGVVGGQAISGNTYTVPASEGNITLRAWARDELGQVGEDTVTISAVPNTAPTVTIAYPGPGEEIEMASNGNQPVNITAQVDVYDPDQGQELSLFWEVVRDVNNQSVTSGTDDNVSFEINQKGLYYLNVTVTDSEGAQGSSSVAFSVTKPNEPEQTQGQLEVTINNPTGGSTYYVGQEVALRASVQQEFADDTIFTWMIDGRGTIGTGAELNHTFTQAGDLTISCVAINQKAATGRNTVDVSILSNTAPEIELSGTPDPEDGIREGAAGTIEAVVTDDEGHQVTLSWLVNGMEAPAGLITDNSLDLSALPAGNTIITLVAVDELGARSSVKISFPIKANQAPAINITEIPAEVVVGNRVWVSYQATDPEGDQVTVEGKVLDPDGNTVPFEEVYNGLSFNTADTGVYVVALTARDTRGAVGSSEETVKVMPNQAPVVEIIEPTPGSTIQTGEEFAIKVNAVDPEGGEITSYSVNGTAVDYTVDDSGNVVIPYTLSQSGAGVLTVSATDEQGLAGEVALGVIVVETTVRANQAPEVNLVLPSIVDGGVPFGGTLNMSAEVNDPDNDEVIVNWLINGKLLGTGLTLNYKCVTAGEITVEIQAVDITGAVGSAQSTIIVQANQAPVGSISVPQALAEYQYQETVNLQADITDPEGHEITYRWLLDGQNIGVGNPLAYTFAKPGKQTLTLRAVDSYGLGTDIQVNISVAPPAGEVLPPEIIEPLDRLVITDGSEITMSAENIPNNAQVIWRSSQDGILSPEGAKLTAGEHLIMLLVNSIQVDSVTVFMMEEQEVSDPAVAIPVNLTGSAILNREPVENLDSDNYFDAKFYNGESFTLNEDSSMEVYFYATDESIIVDMPGTYIVSETELQPVGETN